MGVLDRAYGAIKDHSILWEDPKIREQVQQNYLKALQLKETSPLQQVATLINGISAHCLFLTTSEGEKVTPKGVEKNVLAPPITYRLEGEKYVLTLPHFDSLRVDEWHILLSRLPEIKSYKELVLDLRGNLGKNGLQAIDFLNVLLGKKWVNTLQHELYNGASFRYRVSAMNLDKLRSISVENQALQSHLSDVIAKMEATSDSVVITQVPDYDVKAERASEPDYKGKITLQIDENTKGAAQSVVMMLEKMPQVTVEGPKGPSQRFGEILKVDIAAGMAFHVPRKEEVLARGG